MNDFEKLLLDKMADIEGLNAISIFPLAIGYKLLIFFGCVVFGYFIYKIYCNGKFRKSWQFCFLQELELIEKKLRKEPIKQILAELNEYLKRFCIKKHGRQEVASLSGKKWLRWLTLRDPNGFDWSKKGEILINFPYMPEEKIKVRKGQIKILIKASREWI